LFCAAAASAGDKPYVTDNSNYIVDLYFEDPIKDSHAGEQGAPATAAAAAAAAQQRQ
jgi:hypothetical protein